LEDQHDAIGVIDGPFGSAEDAMFEVQSMTARRRALSKAR
jgi:hypothetical protein